MTNILSRVTGGQVSEIDGTLRSTIDGTTRSAANLYLLNPSGVLFGPNARLDVGGSFHVSTADYLRLADGSRFFAHLSDTSTLSVAAPEAFGFLRDSPAGIALQGSQLQVPEGATLALVGGHIQISGGGGPRSAHPPGGPAGAGHGGECRRAGRGQPAWGRPRGEDLAPARRDRDQRRGTSGHEWGGGWDDHHPRGEPRD